MKISLRDRLVRYMQARHTTWFSSKFLQRLVMDNTTQTARTAVRRLEEMAEEGILEVKYIKGAAQYRYKGAVASKMAPSSDAISKRDERAVNLAFATQLVREFDNQPV